jgi:phosphotransferase system enzyme I (PtsI)
MRAAARLTAHGVPIADPLPPLGAMIEIPGAALAADAIAREAEFFAVGTNDLTQYTLAIDRSDEAVAHLYNPLHPAVLRLIQFTADAARKAKIPICVCGEMAGEPRYAALLLGLGIRDLSMSSSSLPLVKDRIRSITLAQAERCAQAVMEESDSERISRLIDGCAAE